VAVVAMLLITQWKSISINTKNILLGLLASPFVLVPVIYFNIGRVRTQFSRYIEIFKFITGDISWQEASGRSERWEASIEFVSANYNIGTLASPSWVLQDVSSITTIDSAYVLQYLQGGPLLLASYVVLLCIIGLYSFRLVSNNSLGVIPLGLILIVAVHSLTQNFVTGIPGKTVIILSISYYFTVLMVTKE
jgi:hypothetical protein